jgi:hypothetical protein
MSQPQHHGSSRDITSFPIATSTSGQRQMRGRKARRVTGSADANADPRPAPKVDSASGRPVIIVLIRSHVRREDA